MYTFGRRNNYLNTYKSSVYPATDSNRRFLSYDSSVPNGAIIGSANYCKKTFSTSVTDNEYSDCLYDDGTTKYLTPLGLRGGGHSGKIDFNIYGGYPEDEDGNDMVPVFTMNPDSEYLVGTTACNGIESGTSNKIPTCIDRYNIAKAYVTSHDNVNAFTMQVGNPDTGSASGPIHFFNFKKSRWWW